MWKVKNLDKTSLNPVFPTFALFLIPGQCFISFPPSQTGGRFHFWSISFYDSRLNFSKVTSAWGISVFMTIPFQKGKKTQPFYALPDCWERRQILRMPRKKNIPHGTWEKLQVYLGSYILSSEWRCANERLLLQQAGWLSEAAAAVAADVGSLIAVGGPDVFCCQGLWCHITVMNLCKLIAAF